MSHASTRIEMPDRDCGLCPRLRDYRVRLREDEPGWHNAPVESFGDPEGWLAIVGLAPGLGGANRTGRPFTGDQAGGLLYDALFEAGLAEGSYTGKADNSLRLSEALVTNAVRCVPPKNRPTGAEIGKCRSFLSAELDAMPNLSVIVALGTVAHTSIIRLHGLIAARHKFAHGAEHVLPGNRHLVASYHCSRYNQNTGRISKAMLVEIFRQAIAKKSD